MNSKPTRDNTGYQRLNEGYTVIYPLPKHNVLIQQKRMCVSCHSSALIITPTPPTLPTQPVSPTSEGGC